MYSKQVTSPGGMFYHDVNVCGYLPISIHSSEARAHACVLGEYVGVCLLCAGVCVCV